MEPTDNLSGGHCHSHSHSGDYSCPAWTFNQLELEQDLMSSPFRLSYSPPPSLWLPRPPAEGFAAAPENFGDGEQISPLDEMPCLPFCDGQISPLDEVPCIPIPAAVAEETSYAAARAAPLVATHHGTGAGQFSSTFSLSSTTSDNFDEEEVQQKMMALESFLDPPMAPDGLWNTTNGGPAARSHAYAVPPVVQQGTSTTADELPHPQQQLPLPTNDPEAQPDGGWAWLDLSLADEVQIQQMTPTIILPSQPSSPSPVLNPGGPDEANHVASAPMDSQGTLIPAAPQDQEANILSRASTRRRANKSRGLPSRLQDGSGNLFVMGIDMMRQLGRHIGKMRKDEEHRSSIVWQHFSRTSPCKYCGIVTVICPYCNTVMRDVYPSTIELLRHLESIHQLPASSGERSSQALQIKEIAENPDGESEPIEIDNSNNCATAAWVDKQVHAVVLYPWQQHQPLMDGEEQMATILSSQPCCQGPATHVLFKYVPFLEPDSWCDLIIRLSDSSYCSSTIESPHDGFRLKFYDNSKEKAGYKILPQQEVVQVRSSAAWMHVSENRYKDHAGVSLATVSDTIGSSYLKVGIHNIYEIISASAPAGCAEPWSSMLRVLRSLGFRKEFARDLVIYTLGRVDECNLRLRSPRSSNRGISIVEQGDDVPSEKRKRKPLPPRSKVWNHFTKEEAKVEGSMVTVARCKHCGSPLRADSAKHGTKQLKRHITSKHPDKLAKSPL